MGSITNKVNITIRLKFSNFFDLEITFSIIFILPFP